ncbi:PspC domain-containing protein [Candidatus Saccharibacteria bacterium]|nr:PspC domain-containing protein [Candidatus Saccharibacteria bacterium]
MKKVVTINLNGRAYQVEEAGYDALQDYLARTEKTLSKNPDKTEIVADIEQAIAEKCDSVLTGGKNVVSSEQITSVLEKVGPVHETEADSTEEAESVSASAETQRKLYRLPKDEKIAGVCAGLAAYFGTDVTVMRLIFVLLLFITQGFMILIYIALAIVMPEAKKPEEVALAYGRPGTAKQIVERVKEVATDKDTIARVGEVINVVGKALAKIIAIAAALVFGSLTLSWLWVLSAIGVGNVTFYDELASFNWLQQLVLATAVYIVVALPFFMIVRALERVGKPESEKTQRNSVLIDGTMVALLVAATVVISAFAAVYTDRIGEYIKTHDGKLRVGTHTICIDENKCGDASPSDLMPEIQKPVKPDRL